MLHEATNAQRKRKYVRPPCPKAACPTPPYTHTHTLTYRHTPSHSHLYIDIPMLIGLTPLKNLLTRQCRKFALQIMRVRANNAEYCPKKKNIQQIIWQFPRNLHMKRIECLLMQPSEPINTQITREKIKHIRLLLFALLAY